MMDRARVPVNTLVGAGKVKNSQAYPHHSQHTEASTVDALRKDNRGLLFKDQIEGGQIQGMS